MSAALLWLSLLSTHRVAHAADGAARTTAQLVAQLGSADPAAVAAAIDALGPRRDATARAALTAFLRGGQPDAATDRALGALGQQGTPQNLDVLTEFTRHRRATARAAAYAGIARIPVPAADALLGAGLRDSDSAVRVLCARRLGERVAHGQLELLFRAYERGVPDAAFAIGRVGAASDLPRFEQQLGRLPLQTLLLGYEQFLLRSDLGEADKLELIAHLGEVASPLVRRFLGQLRGQRVFADKPRLLLALAQTEGRIRAQAKPTATPAPTAPAPAAATPAPQGAPR